MIVTVSAEGGPVVCVRACLRDAVVMVEGEGQGRLWALEVDGYAIVLRPEPLPGLSQLPRPDFPRLPLKPIWVGHVRSKVTIGVQGDAIRWRLLVRGTPEFFLPSIE